MKNFTIQSFFRATHLFEPIDYLKMIVFEEKQINKCVN